MIVVLFVQLAVSDWLQEVMKFPNLECKCYGLFVAVNLQVHGVPDSPFNNNVFVFVKRMAI